MNETTSDEALRGMPVVTADGIELGTIDALTATYIRLHVPDDMVVSDQLWLPRTMIAAVEGGRVLLGRRRVDIHDAVYSLPPSEQREYASLNLGVRIGRERGLRLA